MTTEQQIVPGHGQGGGQLITESPYITLGGDTLPSIAERCGHPGEWLALAEYNVDHIWGDYNNLQPGLEIAIPAGWLAKDVEEVAEAGGGALDPAELAQLNATDLASLASSATTLAELDAIDAAANGRVTVLNAVSSRRTILLDQGATA